MQVRPIRTQEDYKAMLAAVSALIDLDPEPDSPEGERLEVLGLLVEAYEAKHYPITPPLTRRSHQVLHGSEKPHGRRPGALHRPQKPRV